MALVVIERSVGRNGANLNPDVSKIGAALVSVGPARGGVAAPPPTIAALGQAIENFQRFQRLPTADGKIDPGRGTLKRINEVIAPGASPSSKPGTSGRIRPMAGNSEMATAVEGIVGWTPVEASMVSQLPFNWNTVVGKGRIMYFELEENVVPKWFGVLIPGGVANFDKVHLFFHPTPGQAGYVDSNYQSLGNWYKIFHYLAGSMASQFCAANTGRVLVMPLMTSGSAGTCGILPQRWESIIGRILGMAQARSDSDDVPPVAISSVVVSSFSAGIAYSHHFREKAGLGSRLAGVIDFDGGISSERRFSNMIHAPAGRVVKMHQASVPQKDLARLAAKNFFPLERSRWGNQPYAFAKDPRTAMLQVHGAIPQSMMYIAAGRAG